MSLQEKLLREVDRLFRTDSLGKTPQGGGQTPQERVLRQDSSEKSPQEGLFKEVDRLLSTSVARNMIRSWFILETPSNSGFSLIYDNFGNPKIPCMARAV